MMTENSIPERGATVRANPSEVVEVELPRTWQRANAAENCKSTEESLLIQRARAGDSAAFSLLLQPYVGMSYRVALRITRNAEDAEDVSQESLLEAFRHIDQFHGESQFSTWLTRIVINEALMKLRKRRTTDSWSSRRFDSADGSNSVDIVPAGENAHPEALYLKRQSEQIIRKSIAKLPSGAQAVVWLRGMQELKITETARILELSVSAVKSRFTRARRQLRRIIADQI